MPEITAINCSAIPNGAGYAAQHGIRRVEYWWPFAEEVPSRHDIDRFLASLKGQQLIAMNLYGGDMAAGERGVLNYRDYRVGHLDAVARIAEATGLSWCNTLLGRGATSPTAEQVDRVGVVVEKLKEAGVQPLIEPLSAMDDYPVTTLERAREMARQTGAGVLMDLYHLVASGDLASGDLAANGRLPDRVVAELPQHVQFADWPGRGAPGTGELPLKEWVEQLRAAGYTGDIVGEWVV